MYLETSGETKDDQIALESFHGNPGNYEAIYSNTNTGDDLRFNKCAHIYLRTLVEDPTFDWQKHNSRKEVREMFANLIQKHTGNHPEYSTIESISKNFVYRARRYKKGVAHFKAEHSNWLDSTM